MTLYLWTVGIFAWVLVLVNFATAIGFAMKSDDIESRSLPIMYTLLSVVWMIVAIASFYFLIVGV